MKHDSKTQRNYITKTKKTKMTVFFIQQVLFYKILKAVHNEPTTA